MSWYWYRRELERVAAHPSIMCFDEAKEWAPPPPGPLKPGLLSLLMARPGVFRGCGHGTGRDVAEARAPDLPAPMHLPGYSAPVSVLPVSALREGLDADAPASI